MKGNKLSVYYDFQILCLQKYGGISRYHYDLLQSIQEQELADPVLECVLSQNKYFEKYLHKEARSDSRPIRLLVYAINRCKAARSLRRGYDIVHPTYYDPYALRCKKSKIVVTVHDMIHEIYPDSFNWYDVETRFKKKYIYRADHIIAISESTKRDILKFYPDVPEDKISVIYHGSSFQYSEDTQAQISLPEKYVLFVGRRDSYKNFANFFEAMKGILAHRSDLHVVCIGGGAFNEQEMKQIGEYKDRVMQMNANDSVLAYAYSHAQCFVFPSIYEGFGIPTLEAFACNCPVVLSNSSSMPEVGGDAVVYFNPEIVEEIAKGIEQVVSDPQLQEQLREKGKKQLEKFSWEKTARQTVACYRRVMEQDS